jgi:hypothetical protein
MYDNKNRIREMLKLSDAAGVMQRAMLEFIDNLTLEDFPNLVNRLREELRDVSAVIENLVPIYEKHYSSEDIEAAIAYYSAPAGRHSVEVGPLIQKEAGDVGRTWMSGVIARATSSRAGDC